MAQGAAHGSGGNGSGGSGSSGWLDAIRRALEEVAQAVEEGLGLAPAATPVPVPVRVRPQRPR